LELEAKIASFSTGLILLASYSILFDFQDYAYLFLFCGAAFLLLIAFKGYKIGQSLGAHQIFAALLAIIFVLFPPNLQYVPLVVVLIACIISLRAKLSVFLPSLSGLLWLLFLQYVNLDFLSRPLGTLSANWAYLLGSKCSIDSSGYLHTYFSRTSLPILVDEVKMLLPLYLSILIGYMVLLYILEINLKKILAQITISIIVTFLLPSITLMYLIISPRTILFIPNTWLAFLFPFANIFLLSSITPNVNIVSRIRLPAIFLWIKAKVSTKTERIREKFPKNKTSALKIVTCMLLITFFLLSLLNFVPLQARSDPVIIIDESHSEWEPTWTDYTETYRKDPVSGTNNYFGLLNIFSSVYDCTLIVDRNDKKPVVNSVKTLLTEEVTIQTLENITGNRRGVLILKCVTREYAKSETDAILEFVTRGNGLILISDHTDLWGMSTNLNPIAEQLGYRFLPNAVEDVFFQKRGMVTHKNEFPIFISRFLTGDYYWATGCSLEKLSPYNLPLFEVRSHPSCFAFWRNETAAYFLTRSITEETKLNSQFGSHLILTAIQYGNGKAILMTDSTPFNNGLIGFGEHAQFFMAMVEYAGNNDSFNKSFIPLLMMATAFLAIILNIRNAFIIVVLLILLYLISSSIAIPIMPYTTEFPTLKTEPRAVAVIMPKQYYGEYFSGALNLTKIMDRYFKQNLTAILFPGPPPNEWLHICAQTETYVNE